MKEKHEIGALILRVVLGLIFIGHGTQKFQGGIENIAGWFDSIGLPGFLAYIVASLEVVGGIALILGLATRVVGGLFVLLLLGAIIKVQLAVGFIGGYAYDLALLTISLFLLMNGSKLYSLDKLLFKAKNN
ncbi:DoxX family protein [Anaerobacillus isosaccharinicus]|uniref:DoxX family protein n=1 Tax=Anaerobacillus isosaccharinicus TaxID=1532552 RepID=A0A1S2MF58_9BACI|nr:DoxX family protein [Anaerobacillus isosaccharinicus]MBA5586473.1 DoxX family protein [Anaerobacillus isosaccharinicus]QOY35284.1 DoxX family protein [Anaerobacillus isosaccharinicus]